MPFFGPPDIAKLKAKKDIAGLVKVLVHPKDRSLAVPAADALGEIRNPRAVPLLITALGDEDWKLRASAAEALGKIGDPRAAQPLIAILVDSQWDVRSAAGKALDKIGARAFDPLVAALKNGGALGAAGVRYYAAKALGQIGDARAVEPLIAALKDDEDSYLRGESACSLGHIGDPRAVEPLIAALEDEEDLVARNKAVEALGRIADPGAVVPLIAALDNWSWSGRKEAAEALGKIGDPRAGATLVAALTDRDRGIREAAAQALDRLAWSPERSEAGAAYWVTRGSWDKCVEIGASAVSPLVTAMGLSYDETTRHAAAGALVQIGDAGAMEALMADIRDVTPFDPVEETDTSWNLYDGKTSPHRLAAWALIQIGSPAVPPLVAALADDDPGVCQRAVDTLARIGTPAVEPLIAALENPNKRVSQAAASVLRQLDALPSQWLTGPLPPAGQAEHALDMG